MCLNKIIFTFAIESCNANYNFRKFKISNLKDYGNNTKNDIF